ncbi:MAG: preprotein translocase subunit YajC [Clostridia bacterium]|nr:preprotein translocase subunit YajC [Clostridia bacterium]
MFDMFNLLLNASGGSGNAQPGQGSPWGSMIFMGVLMIGLIVMMIVPQKKREKQARQMLESIKPGTRIRTIGGIYGTVTVVKEDLITIVSGPDDVKLVFAKGAIAAIEPEETSPETDAQETEQTEAE